MKKQIKAGPFRWKGKKGIGFFVGSICSGVDLLQAVSVALYIFLICQSYAARMFEETLSALYTALLSVLHHLAIYAIRTCIHKLSHNWISIGYH